MKKFLNYLICLILTIASLGFVNLEIVGSNQESNQTEEMTVKDKISTLVEEQMNNMTLEQKIGQMLILDSSATSYSGDFKSTMEEIQPGGFIVMGCNITTYEDTRNLIEDMQNDAAIPLIIGMDEEGGNVQRLTSITDHEVTSVPYMYDVGKANDESLAYDVGTIIAQQVRTIGVNVVFAPVADVFSNPDNTVIGKRSLSEDAQIVAKLSVAISNGIEEHGVMSCYKHFPGHGNTWMDSHNGLPVSNKTRKDLDELELIPFYNCIENGASMIMIGHISLPQISGDNVPASINKKIIQDLLIDDMGYDGLIITDALNMDALYEYTDEQIYVMAVNAGVDLLLMPNDGKEALSCIKKAVEEGTIKEETIDKAVKKILTYKYKNLQDYEYLDASYLNKTEYEDVIKKIESKQ